MSDCPCNSGSSYEKCCEPLHKGEHPKTAKELMQARYSAFVKNQVQFIADSHVPETKDFNIDEAREWATNSTWKGLEIVSTKDGGEDDTTGVVEFRALYADKEGKDYLHHEISTFRKDDGIWLYEDGQLVGTGPIVRDQPKVGRNEPCTCGSGKKYKKCCGA